jgi:hypothetical protein
MSYRKRPSVLAAEGQGREHTREMVRITLRLSLRRKPMDLDAVELALEIEQEFGISIGDDEVAHFPLAVFALPSCVHDYAGFNPRGAVPVR